MKTGIKTKVDYKKISAKRCKVCNKPLKYNSELKGHTMCYVCFKISKGKKTMTKSKILPNGDKVTIKNVDLKDLQKYNIRKYKNETIN